MRLIYVSIKIFIGIIIYVGYYCCYVKKNCPKAKFNSKGNKILHLALLTRKEEAKKLKNITYARGINLVKPLF
jgi:hypothetical protein